MQRYPPRPPRPPCPMLSGLRVMHLDTDKCIAFATMARHTARPFGMLAGITQPNETVETPVLEPQCNVIVLYPFFSPKLHAEKQCIMLPRNQDPTEFLYASRKPKQRYREPCRAVVSSMEPKTAVARAEPMPAPRNPQ